MKKMIPLFVLGLSLVGCWKPLDLEKTPIAGNTLALEFSAPVKYVIELKIDGQTIPVRYTSKNRILWVEGLKPGKHDFNLHSISYVFGPEVGKFEVAADKGAYFFIQGRKYLSSTPKNRSEVSIRAYRKKLRKEGIDVKVGVVDESSAQGEGRIRAYFTRHK